MNKDFSTSRNPVVAFLNKAPEEFTAADIIRYVKENSIGMLNFMYPGGDGRLKTLQFVINSEEYLTEILTSGERVDGSSLVPFIDARNSDLYVLPRFSTAFMNPFAPEPTLVMLCSFFGNDGRPVECTPEYALHKASELFRAETSLDFEAMGELEYYVIAPCTEMYPVADQKGYHESGPFAKFENFRARCMSMIAATGGEIKYGHSEVGCFTLNGMTYEQNEIEFLPVAVRKASDQLLIAKWVIRNLAHQENLIVTFSPKIIEGKAGSGLHIHMRLKDKNGRNVMLDEKKELSPEARKLIAGLMVMAPSLTAFGNTIPSSYLRLVPHQEAPTTVCWGMRNRAGLVRVPLGWTSSSDMSALANGLPAGLASVDASQRQTIEIRSGDGSANIPSYLAAIVVAGLHGFRLAEAEQIAWATFLDGNANIDDLEALPASCSDSAECLSQQRDLYEKDGIFSAMMINGQIKMLKSYNDFDLTQRIKADNTVLKQLIADSFHCG